MTKIRIQCYRQCTPVATYNTPAYAAYAVQRLQTAYERHYSGVSFPFPPLSSQFPFSRSHPSFPFSHPFVPLSPHPSPTSYSLPPLYAPLPLSPPFSPFLLPPPPSTPTDYNQSFYTQIREIEAETGCYFDDTFMVDTERAVDYAKVWIRTFQKGRAPCAGLGRR